MMSDIDLFQPGERIGSFEVLRLLHVGGQATVYLAHLWHSDQMSWQQILRYLERHGDTPTIIEQQKLCVLKVANPDQVDYLLNEWDYLSKPQVKHMRLIQTFSERFGECVVSHGRRWSDMAYVELPRKNGTPVSVPYIALAYEPGVSLKQEQEQRRDKPLSPGCAVEIAIQVAEVLDHLHTQARLIHHDISPSNILLRKTSASFWTYKPDVIVIDLAAAESVEHPRLRHIFGKRGYLPPERQLSPQIDIYSLGIVLYELLVGRQSVGKTTTSRSSSSQPTLQPVYEHNQRVSAELDELVMQAIEPDLKLREQYVPSMRHFLERLQGVPEAEQPCALAGNWSRLASGYMVGGFAVLFLIVVVLLGAVYVTNGMIRPPMAVATAVPTVTTIPSQIPTMTPIPPTQAPTSTPAGLSNRSSFMPVTPTMVSMLVSVSDYRH